MHYENYLELSRAEVAAKARRLWKADGRPNGRSLEYWLQAEVELLKTAGAAYAENGNSMAEAQLTFGVANPGRRPNDARRAKVPVWSTGGNGKARHGRGTTSRRACRA
jgi:hypothetical protein